MKICLVRLRAWSYGEVSNADVNEETVRQIVDRSLRNVGLDTSYDERERTDPGN